MLASVAAMQGRIAVWHALGEAVQPLRLATVASNIFTDPEIAAVGVTQAQIEAARSRRTWSSCRSPPTPGRRCRASTTGSSSCSAARTPASCSAAWWWRRARRELILAVSVAVQQRLTVDQLAHTFAVYPSLSGSITEAARRLMQPITSSGI